MPTSGKLELTIKINSFPENVKTVENGWKQFEIDTGEQFITVTVKPKIFKKLEQAQANWPLWVAGITGQMGERTDKGFVLKEPNIQTFERKLKEPTETPDPVESVASWVTVSSSHLSMMFYQLGLDLKEVTISHTLKAKLLAILKFWSSSLQAWSPPQRVQHHHSERSATDYRAVGHPWWR